MSTEKLIIGSDHAGYEMKQALISFIKDRFHQYEVIDVGTSSTDSVDYPIFGHKVGQAVVENKCKGIVICGTGIGISIAANKIQGVRCALCHDATTARLCREHNDANVLSLGARIIGLEVAKDAVSVFLTTEPLNEGRHKIRREMIEAVTPSKI
ncbi:ribose 5-phosphate isomerase [Monocercomonoides exilis]|uniref:ribose 5-phosphate isomerase n=1 Tax=Monocercomonoides exilis TaxID=2049356 RepID=UPI00355997ED|nr:ribose 5-phosphate isomerase [Monocercomonoides exilis]|eukprot:MONOS_374.1-p1 / transcript=MONOS_374.1 / gene=MONOS_374 / organism=Monocercomonoides_exilis_PA203 / gene_product=ribose 5-phosphate isomerase / transcript_product=ribose 5-phosphate isomerase / location=Mono_scaffold00006:101725-102296(+) / protein_length=154 / sequence_SO=supercontig / SO=protein_coding / is_pseudo=false